MIAISYFQMVVAISIIWLIVRGICWKKNKKIDLKREAQLLFVYICIVVVVRFTFCPFGLVDGRARTLEEVGKEFSVTRERIRQIEAKALRKLRHPSRSKRIKDYLD